MAKAEETPPLKCDMSLLSWCAANGMDRGWVSRLHSVLSSDKLIKLFKADKVSLKSELERQHFPAVLATRVLEHSAPKFVRIYLKCIEDEATVDDYAKIIDAMELAELTDEVGKSSDAAVDVDKLKTDHASECEALRVEMSALREENETLKKEKEEKVAELTAIRDGFAKERKALGDEIESLRSQLADGGGSKTAAIGECSLDVPLTRSHRFGTKARVQLEGDVFRFVKGGFGGRTYLAPVWSRDDKESVRGYAIKIMEKADTYIQIGVCGEGELDNFSFVGFHGMGGLHVDQIIDFICDIPNNLIACFDRESGAKIGDYKWAESEKQAKWTRMLGMLGANGGGIIYRLLPVDSARLKSLA